jgi:hypothetical protein
MSPPNWPMKCPKCHQVRLKPGPLQSSGPPNPNPRVNWHCEHCEFEAIEYVTFVTTPYCPFCKKRHVGGDTCLGHHP